MRYCFSISPPQFHIFTSIMVFLPILTWWTAHNHFKDIKQKLSCHLVRHIFPTHPFNSPFNNIGKWTRAGEEWTVSNDVTEETWSQVWFIITNFINWESLEHFVGTYKSGGNKKWILYKRCQHNHSYPGLHCWWKNCDILLNIR